MVNLPTLLIVVSFLNSLLRTCESMIISNTAARYLRPNIFTFSEDREPTNMVAICLNLLQVCFRIGTINLFWLSTKMFSSVIVFEHSFKDGLEISIIPPRMPLTDKTQLHFVIKDGPAAF